MLVIGLTGGIASGKSAVSSLLQSHQIPLIDADVLARRVVEPGTRTHSRIVSTFGSSILLEDGSQRINRPKLGKIIFNDEAKRKKLNAIVHPAVRWEMVKLVAVNWLKGKKFVVVDVPLLIESKLYRFVGKTVVVYCSQEIQIQRLTKRDSSSQSAALSRINSQIPLSSKLPYADYVIDNSGSLQDLQQQVDIFVKKLYREIGWTWRLSWLIPPLGLFLGFWKLVWRAVARQRKFKKAARRNPEDDSGNGSIRLGSIRTSKL